MKIPCKKATIKPERNILCLIVVQQDKGVTRRIVLILLTKALYEFGCLKEKVWLFLKFWIWQCRYFTEFSWHDFAWPERNIPKLTVCVLASCYHLLGHANIFWSWNFIQLLFFVLLFWHFIWGPRPCILFNLNIFTCFPFSISSRVTWGLTYTYSQ